MIIVFAGIAAVIFITDILIKQSVEEQMDENEEKIIFSEKITFRKVYNKGMMMNLLDKYPAIVTGISVVLGITTAGYDIILLIRRGHYLEKTGMMLFTGGALSNIFDRVVRGKVIDYFGFRTKWKKFNQITFNLGDIFIMLGAALAAAGKFIKK